MKTGYAVVDITPDLGVELSGYGYYLERKAESVLDSLFARAVMFQEGEKKLLLINCDLLILTKPIVDRVKGHIHDELGLDEKCIMLLSSHTHSGPSTGGIIGIGEPDNKYLEVLPDLLFEAGKAAFQNVREVNEVKHFVVPFETIGFNRVDSNKPIDNRLHGMAFYFDEGNPLAIVSCGCHPVTLGKVTSFSADYPGRVVKMLSNEGFEGIFLNGFCGNIDPLSNLEKWGEGTEETIDGYGTLITSVFTENIAKAGNMRNFTLDAFEITVKMELQRYGEKELQSVMEEYSEEKDENPSFYRAIETWKEYVKRRIGNDGEQYFENLIVQVFRIGEVILVGVPGEIFSHFGIIIKEFLQNFNVMTLGCANGVSRYIADKEDILNSGYAGFSSCFLYQQLPLIAGEGERMTEAIASGIKEMLEPIGKDSLCCEECLLDMKLNEEIAEYEMQIES